jgi:hypothetical protein
MKDKKRVPESFVSTIKFSQRKNVKNHRPELYAKIAVCFGPPLVQFINGTSLVKFPMKMEGDIETLSHTKRRDENKE